jgi:hypothetical protein
MRTLLCTSILASFALTFCAAYSAGAENAAQVRKSIEAGYLKKDTSTNHKDLAGMMSVYAPGAKVVHPNGRVVTTGEMQKQLTNILPTVKSVAEHEVVKDISLEGNRALVKSSKTSTTVTEEPSSHKEEKVVQNVSSEDTWIKIGNKWLLKEIRVLSAKATVNGKPMPER